VGILGGLVEGWSFRALATSRFGTATAWGIPLAVAVVILAIGWGVTRFSYRDFFSPDFD
jgi:hypothetical protein